MIEARTINGRSAIVSYLDDDFQPVMRGRAHIIKVVYDDGDLEFLGTHRHLQDAWSEEAREASIATRQAHATHEWTTEGNKFQTLVAGHVVKVWQVGESKTKAREPGTNPRMSGRTAALSRLSERAFGPAPSWIWNIGKVSDPHFASGMAHTKEEAQLKSLEIAHRIKDAEPVEDTQLDRWFEDAKKAKRTVKAKKQQKAKQKQQAKKRSPKANIRKPRKPKPVEQWLGEEPLEVGVLTAGDHRVCDECDEYAAGAPYDIDEVEDALPMHPNCRCTWFPWDDKRFEHDAEPPDFLKDPVTGRWMGSRSRGGSEEFSTVGRRERWVRELEQRRQQWSKKFGGRAEEKQFKNWKASYTAPEHKARVSDILSNIAQISTTYRWQMKMYMEEADKFAKEGKLTPTEANAEVVGLKAKIGQSFYRQAMKMQQKGESTYEVNKLIGKAAGLGYKPIETGLGKPIIEKPHPDVIKYGPQQYHISGSSQTYKTQAEAIAALETEPEEVPIPAANEVSGWKKITGQKGSNPGGTYEDPQGVQWYVKTPQSEDHVANDLLTQRLYKLAGLSVPIEKKVTLNDQPSIASAIISGVAPLGDRSEASQKASAAKIREGFAVDAWLGNRDVIGLEKDNILTSEEGLGVFRVDFGGGLKYRAQGQEKPFGKAALELMTLRDPSINAQSAAIFGSMTDQEVADSASKVFAISPGQIMTEANLLGIPEVGQTLVARRQWLGQWVAQNAKLTPESQSAAGQAAELPAVKAKGPDLSGESGGQTEWMTKLEKESPPTIEETTKAQKTGQFYPAPTSATGQALVAPWNAKWATKTGLTQQETIQKVIEYKATKAKLATIEQMESSAKEKMEAEAKATAAAQKKAEAQALKAKEEAETAAHQKVIHDLAEQMGLSPKDADQVDTLIHLAGKSPDKVVAEFKAFQKSGTSQLGLPISPFEYAMVRSYVGSAYRNANEKLRSGFWDMKTHVFANAINTALAKLPGYDQQIKRGFHLEKPTDQEGYVKGAIVEWKAFSSCGKSSSFAGNMQCVIQPLPADKTRFRDLGQINAHEAGGEVLGMARSTLKITKVEGKPGGPMKVWMDEVEFK